MYDGWQLLEETDAAGTLLWQGVNGRDIDEPLVYWDHLGRERRVLQDRLGSVIGVADDGNRLLERYAYSPYGRLVERHGPEHLDHARLEGEALVLRFTAAVDPASALEVGGLVFTPDVAGSWETSANNRELRFTPDGPWPASVGLAVASVIKSAYQIELAESRSLSFQGADPDGPVQDWVPPKVEQVVQESLQELRVVFSEPVAPASLQGAFTLTERGPPSTVVPITVAPGADPTIAVITVGSGLTVGQGYELELAAGAVTDLAGQPTEAATWPWTAGQDPTRIWDPADIPAATASILENKSYFQARDLDPTTGLLDFRNRWFDTGLGRFLQRDPLGYGDGPNLYGFSGADPVNYGDPVGTARGRIAVDGVDVNSPREAGIMARQGRAALEAYRSQQTAEGAARQAAILAYRAEYERIYGRPPSPEEVEAAEAEILSTGFEHLAALDQTFAPGLDFGLVEAGGKFGAAYLNTGSCKTPECLEAARAAGASWLEPDAARQRGRYLGQVGAGTLVRIGQAGVASSAKLAANLERSGVARPAGTAAHHMVAGRSRKAADARLILDRFGIDINDAVNGVFLPASRPCTACYHPSLHTDRYFNRVNDLLSSARTREQAVEILNYIREKLTQGGSL